MTNSYALGSENAEELTVFQYTKLNFVSIFAEFLLLPYVMNACGIAQKFCRTIPQSFNTPNIFCIIKVCF